MRLLSPIQRATVSQLGPVPRQRNNTTCARTLPFHIFFLYFPWFFFSARVNRAEKQYLRVAWAKWSKLETLSSTCESKQAKIRQHRRGSNATKITATRCFFVLFLARPCRARQFLSRVSTLPVPTDPLADLARFVVLEINASIRRLWQSTARQEHAQLEEVTHWSDKNS